jgi:uncharacterized protein YycO
MKKLLVLLSLLVSFTSCKSELLENDTTKFKDGDIIFHTSKSSQSKMLQMATNSDLTHVGVIFYKGGKPYVIEAVQPVTITPLQSFINRGVNSEYKVMRPDVDLTESQKQTMMSYGKKQLGKNYDKKFQWGDDKIYCSELVWKMYKEAGIELCETKMFSDFNLSNPKVKEAVKSRFNGDFNPSEVVVAPSDIADSDILDTVFDNF